MRVSDSSERPPGADVSARAEPFGFAAQVRDALAHLHDPRHLQTHPLTRFVRSDASASPTALGRALYQALLDAINALRPPAAAGPTSRARREHDVIRLRYLEGLDVPQVLDRLALSRSLYYLELGRAVDALSALLWERWGLGERAEGGAARRTADLMLLPQRPTTNLPIQLTSFVGREREIAEIKRLLSTTRLLTLTGTGGCGKTRLALQIAQQLRSERTEEYADGVWFVDLTPNADPALVPQAIASSLDLPEAPGRSPLDSLVGHLRQMDLLLVLDNCEHLIAACAEVVEGILRACPRVTVLATSRELLRVAGEVTWRVVPLSAPAHGEADWTGLLDYEAARLFVERAELVQPGFAVTEGNAPHIARICRQLDGMPLSIELAAARVRGLSVDDLAARLDDRFRLLSGARRTARRRQQTLRATLDWSYDLLDEPERVLFSRLAVFAGGWTLDAAQGIGAGGEITEEEAVDLLLRLVDRSLVVLDAESRPPRYRLLETIRQYAEEKAAELGELPSARDRHLEWYLALAERSRPEPLTTGRTRDWLERMDREQDNLRAALAWSLERTGDGDASLRLAAVLGPYWNSRLRMAETMECLGPVLVRPGGDPITRAVVLTYAAIAESMAGRWRTAREMHEEALVLAREIGDRRLIARALVFLSYVPWDIGDYAEARALREEALGLARGLDDRYLLADMVHHLTTATYAQGDDETARALAREGLEIYREVGDLDGAASHLALLARLAVAEGCLEEARALAREALTRARESGTEVISYGSFAGDIARAEGELTVAEHFYKEVLEARRRDRLTGMFASTTPLASLAGLWAERGRPREAALLFGAVRGWLAARDMSLPWNSPRHYLPDLAATREALGEDAFAEANAEGQAMNLEQAVEYALERELD